VLIKNQNKGVKSAGEEPIQRPLVSKSAKTIMIASSLKVKILEGGFTKWRYCKPSMGKRPHGIEVVFLRKLFYGIEWIKANRREPVRASLTG
jgi:hypothetical protein